MKRLLAPSVVTIAASASLAIAATAAMVAGCGDSSKASPDPPPGPGPDGGTSAFEWRLPVGFPTPKVPNDNPMTAEKVDLGRHLFYDTRLSGNGTFSCASCHEQGKAFTDGLARSKGSTGELHPRGSMSLTNVGYAKTLTWANDLMGTLEKQALVPMFGEAPIELGLAGHQAEMLEKLRKEPYYQTAFPRAFPGTDEPFATLRIVEALSAFQRTLISGRSPYDKWAFGGEKNALSDSAKRGRDLFFSETLECFHCHGGFNFSDSSTHTGGPSSEGQFHNTALYNLDGKGAYPADNRGLMDVSTNPADMGRFKAPTLRNIAVTAPYMHDGSIATLEEVLDHYAAGGRTIKTGPNAGDGSKSPLKSEFVIGFVISDEQKRDVIHFLESLTDNDFLTDPRFANPWTAGRTP
ncbi:MbnH family di-heme enzyme [Pendulispora albinea]|uniref:Di-heme enzyme n=1 Tax=Pendulispora albinea TaxID=2741071 RepID=A0ABZ2LNJ8_9BACT